MVDATAARSADRLTVVDSSSETLELNRERVRRADVEYVVADLFTWQSQRTYDVVFFSFWLSHVPRSRFGAFWSTVRTCLTDGGRVFLIDNRDDPTPGRPVKDPYVERYEQDLHLRRLNDGSTYRVVKVMYEPDELATLLRSEGWNAALDGTRWFIFGSVRRTERRRKTSQPLTQRHLDGGTQMPRSCIVRIWRSVTSVLYSLWVYGARSRYKFFG